MDKRVSTLLEVIPDRAARLVTGVPFLAETASSRHPERLAHIAQHLSWLTPLVFLTVDDQRILGLVNAAGRPVHSSDLEEGEGGGELEAADAEPDPREPGATPTLQAEHAIA